MLLSDCGFAAFVRSADEDEDEDEDEEGEDEEDEEEEEEPTPAAAKRPAQPLTPQPAAAKRQKGDAGAKQVPQSAPAKGAEAKTAAAGGELCTLFALLLWSVSMCSLAASVCSMCLV